MVTNEQFLENSRSSAYVGLIPAAGVGSRLPNRTGSKEILPVTGLDGRQRPVISHLLTSMALAGVTDVTAIIREGKHDVTEYLSEKHWHQMSFSNVFTSGTSGVPETVAIGLERIGARNVLFGFPDILFEPQHAFEKMIRELESGFSDIVLGLFPTTAPSKMDMVQIDNDGQVVDIEIKPSATSLKSAWILAAWTPAFGQYLREAIAKNRARAHLGEIFKQAITEGLSIGSTSFNTGRSIDIGTPSDLARANRWLK